MSSRLYTLCPRRFYPVSLNLISQREMSKNMYDLLIIGSGPSGLAAALSAKPHGLTCLIIERGEIAQTICNYPLGKNLFSTSNEVELEYGALPTTRKPTREEVLHHYKALVEKAL